MYPLLDALVPKNKRKGIVSKPRPLLVTFNSAQSKKNVLSNSRNLAKSIFKHVSVCPDLRKTQQTEDKKQGMRYVF